VMSCRAFSRRIEHACLRYLFEHVGAEEIILDFAPTMRNGPLQEFLNLFRSELLEGQVRLHREDFDKNCPSLFHTIRKTSHE
jgi:predicted enzyme involved in methoxymalonyl-ACP biosynthesis